MSFTEFHPQVPLFPSMYAFLNLGGSSTPPVASTGSTTPRVASMGLTLTEHRYLVFIQAVPFLVLVALLSCAALFGLSRLVSPLALLDVRLWVMSNHQLTFIMLLAIVAALVALPEAPVQAFVDGSAFGVSPLTLFSAQLAALLMLLDIERYWPVSKLSSCYPPTTRTFLDGLSLVSDEASFIHETVDELVSLHNELRHVRVIRKWRLSFTSVKTHLPTVPRGRRVQFLCAKDRIQMIRNSIAFTSAPIGAGESRTSSVQVVANEDLLFAASIPLPEDDDLFLATETILPEDDEDEDLIFAASIALPGEDEDDELIYAASIPLPDDDELSIAMETPLPEGDDEDLDEVFHAASIPLPDDQDDDLDEVLYAASISLPADHELFLAMETPLPEDNEGDKDLDEVLYAASIPLPGGEDEDLDEVFYAASIPLPGSDEDESLDEVVYAASIPLPGGEDQDLDEVFYAASVPLPSQDDDEDLDEVHYAASISLPGGEDEDLDEVFYAASVPLPSEDEDEDLDEVTYAASVRLPGDDQADEDLDEVLYAASIPIPGEDQDDNLDEVVYAASIPLPRADEDEDLDEVFYAASIPLPDQDNDEDLDEVIYAASISLPGGEDQDLDEVLYAASLPLPNEDEDDNLDEVLYAASIPLPGCDEDKDLDELFFAASIPLPADDELFLAVETPFPGDDEVDKDLDEVVYAASILLPDEDKDDDLLYAASGADTSPDNSCFDEVTLVEETDEQPTPAKIFGQSQAPEVVAPKPRQRQPLNQRFLNSLIMNNKTSNERRMPSGLPVPVPTLVQKTKAPTATPEQPKAPEVVPRQRQPLNQRFLNNLVANNSTSNERGNASGPSTLVPVPPKKPQKVDWRRGSVSNLASQHRARSARARQSASNSLSRENPAPGGANVAPASVVEAPPVTPAYVPSRRNRKKKDAAEAAAAAGSGSG